jgi:hypothetical protein
MVIGEGAKFDHVKKLPQTARQFHDIRTNCIGYPQYRRPSRMGGSAGHASIPGVLPITSASHLVFGAAPPFGRDVSVGFTQEWSLQSLGRFPTADLQPKCSECRVRAQRGGCCDMHECLLYHGTAKNVTKPKAVLPRVSGPRFFKGSAGGKVFAKNDMV